MPTLAVLGAESFKLIMIVVITIAGLILIFASVCVHIHHGLGSTVVDGIFRGIGWVVRQIVRSFVWLFTSIYNLLKKECTSIYNGLKGKGWNSFLAGLLAGVVTLVTLIVII
jgi:hypothetical protein